MVSPGVSRELEPPPAAPAAGEFAGARAFSERALADPLLAPALPVGFGRAPGRLDVLGGIADYSGAPVLSFPLSSAAHAAAQPAEDGRVVAVTGGRRIAIAADELLGLPLDRLARRLADLDASAPYVLGPIALLAREEQVPLEGLRLVISSDVPEGKGLGSSAAVEVAVLQAVAAVLLGRLPEPRRLALLGQRAEQLVAGAPCGVMDQMTAACGAAGRLLLLVCRPAEVERSIALRPPLRVWGIDSGVRHAVAGVAYRRVRCASFIGKALLGLDGHLTALDGREPDPAALPEWVSGAAFLRAERAVDDPVSVVEPDVLYPVRAATAFPLEEQRRVRRFAELVAGPLDRARATALGELMYESHLGYSRCGLGTPATDAIVDAVRRAGWSQGLVGARASGGGSGGTVVVVGRAEAEPVVAGIARRLGAGLVGGTSAGAGAFGLRVLAPGR